MPWLPSLTTGRLCEGNTWKFFLEILSILTVHVPDASCYIRRDQIVERMAVITEDAWSVPALEPPPARTTPPGNMYSKEILSGRWDVSDAEGRMLKEHAEKYGIDLKTFK